VIFSKEGLMSIFNFDMLHETKNLKKWVWKIGIYLNKYLLHHVLTTKAKNNCKKPASLAANPNFVSPFFTIFDK
jgi:hypothetical protein